MNLKAGLPLLLVESASLRLVGEVDDLMKGEVHLPSACAAPAFAAFNAAGWPRSLQTETSLHCKPDFV